MTETAPTIDIKTAWDTEYGEVVVYGTHDPAEAQKLYTAYLTECGFAIGDEEGDARANEPEFYEGMRKLWTSEKDDEEPFDTFTEPGKDREPYMFAAL